jgi:predicted CXXCH cytochrome family protein
MSENPPEELVNPQFVRQPYSTSRNDFCFICHQPNDYQKQNPHRQYDQAGTLNAKTCLFCHQATPHPEQENPLANIPFKNDQTRICMSCHAGKKDNHPTRGNHLVTMPDSMKEEFDAQTAKRGIYLPLPDSVISCTTCHNPHQVGVIKRKEAKEGSSNSFFLRISRGRELCTTCHTNLKLPRISGQREAVSSLGPERTVEHKPYREKKCKACHAIDGFKQFSREKLFLCFQNGCHEPTMLDHSSVHEPSVLGSCTFCHNPHSSGYEKLLFNTEDKLCSTCHPLLRDENNSSFTVSHQQLASFTTIRAIPSEYECSFCHNLNHKKDIFAVSTDLCSDCHIYLRENFSQNQHQQATEQSCSACHDPHTSPHHYQLRKSPETYGW